MLGCASSLSPEPQRCVFNSPSESASEPLRGRSTAGAVSQEAGAAEPPACQLGRGCTHGGLCEPWAPWVFPSSRNRFFLFPENLLRPLGVTSVPGMALLTRASRASFRLC